MYALNNLLRGEHLFDAQDMTDACNTVLCEKECDGIYELRSRHERDLGWYSEEVLAKALQATMQFQLLLQPLRDNAQCLHAPEIMGALSNQGNTHWVALLAEGEDVWLLDSLHEPQRLKPAEYTAYLRKHQYTYPVRRIGAPP